MSILQIALVLLTLIPLQNASTQENSEEERYLCIADKATGFIYNETGDEWETTTFNVEDSRYIVAKSDHFLFERFPFSVTQVGAAEPMTACEEGFNRVGLMGCRVIRDFVLNRINGRFVHTNTSGYYDVLPGFGDITDATSGTPFIEIGKCSPF